MLIARSRQNSTQRRHLPKMPPASRIVAPRQLCTLVFPRCETVPLRQQTTALTMYKSPAMPPDPSPSPRSPAPLNPAHGSYIELDEMADHEHRQYPQPGPALPPRPAKPEGLQDVVNSWWLLELFAWVTSAVALVVLIVTLFLADDRPLPHWPMRITLNSFVSILGTIMKAAMVVPIAEGISQLKWLWFKKAGVLKDIQTFDEASRGMWGSLKLLLSTKGV